MTLNNLVAVPLSLLLGDAVDDMQEPRLAKRYGLDQLTPAVQQQAASEVVDTLLLQQAAAPAGFEHGHITLFSVGSSRLSCEGADILSCFRRRALAPGPTLMQMSQIAMGLAHLHANGVVHGHVHPAIIRIKDDCNATLIHTGAYTAARRVLQSHTQYIPNQESFIWQAPEFVKMEDPGAPTKAEDVYAFGSTLYTAFTGVAPFAGRHRRLETAIVEIGLHGHRRLPQPDDISDGLWEIIRCCWEYDPATRPHMGYVVDALIALIPRSRPGPALSIKDHLKRVPTVAPLSP